MKGKNDTIMAPKVALLTIALAGERIDLAKKFALLSKKTLVKTGMKVIGNGDMYLTGREVMKAVIDAQNNGADCAIYLIGTWVNAPDVITAIQKSNLPAIIWGLPEAASFSSVGANVVHGSLDEIGIKHKLVYGMPDEIGVIEQIAVFARASMINKVLSGSRFGLIGGRSIGMYPSTADPIQIKRIFGIEIEHIDQLLLVEYAKMVSDELVSKIFEKMKDEYGRINIPENVLKKSIRVYFALKKLIEERELNFIGVKCLGEFINNYVSCCLGVALLNNDGIMTACQSDINAGIAMKVVNILTEQPAIFADVNVVDNKTKFARLINCGSMPTSLARNKKEVDWGYQYEYMGKGRGACPIFCCKPGEVTFGTFSRINGNYVMQIARGTAVNRPKSVFKQARDIWPHAFIKLHCDPGEFYQNIRTNHIIVGYGDISEELVAYCDLVGIKPIVIN